MIVSSGVDDELDVVWPARGGVRHVNLLPIPVMVRDGSIEHTEPSWCSEISA